MLYFGFADTVPAGSEGWQSPLVHSTQAYACNHLQYVAASWPQQKMLLTLLGVALAGKRAGRERKDGQICLCLGEDE